MKNGIIVGGICGQNDDGKGIIPLCYSDSSVYSADPTGTYSNKLTNVDTKTTEVLCGSDFWNESGFGSE